MNGSTLDLPTVATLEQEKASRSAALQKLDSNLVLALRRSRGELSADAPQSAISIQPDGRVLVDIDATVSSGLLAYIKQIGGLVINSFASARAVRAAVPLEQMELLAARPDIKFISPAALATTNRGP